MELEDLLSSYYGMSVEDLQTQAEQVVKQKVVINAIAEAEKLSISDEEYQQGLQQYASDYGFSDTSAFEEQYDKEEITLSLLFEKVMNFVVENAKEKEGFVYESPSSANSSDSSGSESSSESK